MKTNKSSVPSSLVAEILSWPDLAKWGPDREARSVQTRDETHGPVWAGLVSPIGMPGQCRVGTRSGSE